MQIKLDQEGILRLKLISKFFKGFADYSRLCIFESLMEGEKTVTEIIEFTGFSQSKISNHLKCLRESDLVEARQEGKFIYYSMKDEKIKTIFQLAKEVMKDISEEKLNCMKY
ncbi:ArsR/SmtB family transcription factor [Thermotalea metallivorans]|uniref:HTH-type transcriptional repressor CzrA n=1 Tax=Thermotalea metallivorans TaxID=520762 RepID=A0A140L1H8_9FIRM|nr:metalloregulator ArsR/SmtB family transcription factor [Thermotalea metallivorans]KXG74403.1 HTH-type transcriptional repressor CzrA [Thermotalea metallivorans]